MILLHLFVVVMAYTKECHRYKKFLRFSRYYRRFVKDFSKIAMPMTNLMKKDDRFNWNEDIEKAFQTLKEK